MTETSHNHDSSFQPAEPELADSTAGSGSTTETRSNHGVSKAATFGAVGLAAMAGVAHEAKADSSPVDHSPAAKVQPAGDHPISTGEVLKTARVSATELLNMRAKTSETKQSSEKYSAKDPEQYTQEYKDAMRSGKVQFVYFNGTVIVSNKAKIYSCIDPDLRPYGVKNSCNTGYPWISTRDAGKYSGLEDMSHKFGAGYRSVITLDSKGQPWLMFTLESGGFRAYYGNGVPDTQEYPTPTNQLILNFYVPFKGNEDQLKFYKSSPGQPTFLAGAILASGDSNFNTSGNFICTTPGFQNEKSDFLAVWQTTNKSIGRITNGSIDRPAFESTKFLKSFTANPVSGKPYKEFKMPGPKQLKQIIYKTHHVYQGGD